MNWAIGISFPFCRVLLCCCQNILYLVSYVTEESYLYYNQINIRVHDTIRYPYKYTLSGGLANSLSKSRLDMYHSNVHLNQIIDIEHCCAKCRRSI